MSRRFRPAWILAAALWALAPSVVLSQEKGNREGQGPETAGWHVLRPGEDLQSVASFYLPRLGKRAGLAELNPRLRDPQPGDRVLIKLLQGLPGEAALVGKLAGRVEAQPTPVDWLRSRRFDLLTGGDGVRTFPNSSVEMRFTDATSLVLTEESLVFLRGSGASREGSGGGEDIEILEGQGDLLKKASRRATEESFEVLVGPARLQTKAASSGALAIRARKAKDSAQVMVYEGSSRVSGSGGTVQVEAGEGSVISSVGEVFAPEPLLSAPTLQSPGPRAPLPWGPLEFRWDPVSGAQSYVLEVCLDSDCSELVWRIEDVKEKSIRWQPQAPGRYSWRVTARAASRLDGYPAPASAFLIEAPEGWGREGSPSGPRQSIAGQVRSHPDALPLPGAIVRIVELGIEGRTSEDGTFALGPLPTGTYTVEAHLPGFVVVQNEGVGVLPRRSTEVQFFLRAAPLIQDAIVVRPSQVTLLQESTGGLMALSRDEILALPHLGDDIFRALSVLPGTTANDVSAQIQVRGGRRDEVQILLDGQEIYNAYHLRDFDNALSIVAPATLAGVELMTGAFPAQFGDRMGAVLQLTSLQPPSQRWYRLGLSLLNLQAGAGGPWAEGRGDGFVVARRGALDLAGKLFGPERPRYWDLFAKAGYQVGTGSSFAARGLVARDDLDFQLFEDGETKTRSTHHGSTYAWLDSRTLLSSRLLVDNSVAWSDFEIRRDAVELEEEQDLEVLDRRSHEVVEGRTSWSFQASPRHFLTWGGAFRSFDAPYDYFSVREYAPTTVALIRSDGGDGEVRFKDRFKGDHSSAYLSDRLGLGAGWTVELGARWDHYTITGDSAVSPRISLAKALGERSVLRAAWGRFHQSQRPYELLVEDGDSALQPVERSEHWLLGLEHLFSPTSRLAGSSFRLEAYRREISNPRRRYDNLFEPFNTFPELEPDRVLFAAENSLADGVEVLFRGPARKRFSWWVAYTYARSRDRIAGRWVPRVNDQRHALNLNLALELPRDWVLNMALRAHTGWPTTPLSLIRVPGEEEEEGDGMGEMEDGEMEDGEMDDDEGMEDDGSRLVPLLGAVNSLRLADYHRLDLRLSRKIPVAKGRLTFFIDIQNAYNRKNASGFDHEIDEDAEVVERVREVWPGIFPSIGLTWEF